MCYGMQCPYEDSWTGECNLHGASIPLDASCRSDEEWTCNQCGHEFALEDAFDIDKHDERVQCPECMSSDTEQL